jgi:hypothetical protein
MNPRPQRWWLVTQLPPSQPESKGDLEILREVSEEEERQTREANALLNRLVSAAPYARLVELYEELTQALGRDASPVRRAADMNRVARALGKVAAELPGDLLRHARADFGDGSDKGQELEAAIAEEAQRVPFRLLVAVGKLVQGPFAPVGDGVGNEAEAMTTLMADVPEVQPHLDLVSALRAGIVVAQRLIARQLQIYEERVDDASLYLRRLAAEVADGAPALMRADSFDPEGGETNLGQTTFDPLALDKALYLHRALKHARELLKATGGGREESADDAPEGESIPVAAEPVPEAPEGAAPSDAQLAGDSEETSEPPPGDRGDQVLDLRALAQHATAFTDDLEKAWSAALDDALLAQAQDEMNARYASLLRTIQRRVAAGDRALRDAGVDPQVPAYPLHSEEIGRLSLEPDDERRWRQLQLAELDALMLLLEALEAIRAPSAQTIYVDEKRVETWWEAGAFALVRDRVDLLVRVSEQAALAEAAVMNVSLDSTAPSAFFDRLRLAADALGHGDVEATLVHARLALHLRAGLEVDVVPNDLLERLANDPRLAGDAPLLRLLEQAGTKLAAGEALDIGAAVLIAARALAVVGGLCLETPQIIGEVLRGESGRDGS